MGMRQARARATTRAARAEKAGTGVGAALRLRPARARERALGRGPRRGHGLPHVCWGGGWLVHARRRARTGRRPTGRARPAQTTSPRGTVPGALATGAGGAGEPRGVPRCWAAPAVRCGVGGLTGDRRPGVGRGGGPALHLCDQATGHTSTVLQARMGAPDQMLPEMLPAGAPHTWPAHTQRLCRTAPQAAPHRTCGLHGASVATVSPLGHLGVAPDSHSAPACPSAQPAHKSMASCMHACRWRRLRLWARRAPPLPPPLL